MRVGPEGHAPRADVLPAGDRAPVIAKEGQLDLQGVPGRVVELHDPPPAIVGDVVEERELDLNGRVLAGAVDCELDSRPVRLREVGARKRRGANRAAG